RQTQTPGHLRQSRAVGSRPLQSRGPAGESTQDAVRLQRRQVRHGREGREGRGLPFPFFWTPFLWKTFFEVKGGRGGQKNGNGIHGPSRPPRPCRAVQVRQEGARRVAVNRRAKVYVSGGGRVAASAALLRPFGERYVLEFDHAAAVAVEHAFTLHAGY